jgi:hypothetical protein
MPVRFRQEVYSMPWHLLAVAPNYTNLQLSSATSRIAWEIVPEETETLTRLLFKASGTAAAPPTYRVGIAAWDVATSRPNLASVLSSVNWTPGTSLPNQGVEITGLSAAVTRGTSYAAFIDYVSGTVGASNAVTIYHTFENGIGPIHYANPAVFDDTTGSGWTVRMGTATSYPSIAWGTGSRTYGAMFGTTPTEALAADGDRMAVVMPWPDRFVGGARINEIQIQTLSNTANVLRVGVWNAAGTALCSQDLNMNRIATQSNLRIWTATPATRPVIAAGTTLYVGYERVGGYDPLTRHAQVPNNACLDMFPLGTGCTSARWTGGAWTPITDRVFAAHVVLDEVADATGGGGGVYILEG